MTTKKFEFKYSLGSADVDIWSVDLDTGPSEIGRYQALLSEEERQRAQRLYFEKDQWQFIVARGVLKILLGRYLHTAPSTIQLEYGAHGKPFLRDVRLQFNLSHAHNMALIGIVMERRIGVDIEYIQRPIEMDLLARRFFAKNEQRRLRTLPASQQHVAFFNCWTRKEAFIKACGQGLSLPLDQFEVSIDPNEAARLLTVQWDKEAAGEWTLEHVIPAQDYVGAVAVEQKNTRLRRHSYDHN